MKQYDEREKQSKEKAKELEKEKEKERIDEARKKYDKLNRVFNAKGKIN